MAQGLSETDIERVKNSVNIVDVINQYVALQKRGKNYFGFCPFHDERTPSFSVTADKQIYKCFSCGRAGNVFSFFMEKDGDSFQEAVLKVAQLGHVPLDVSLQERRELTPQEKEAQEIKRMHQLVMDFYHHILINTKEGEVGLTYLLDRGLTLETIKAFKMGVSLADRNLLSQLLASHDFDEAIYDKSGLFVTYQGQRRDRFFDRIMVPLRDEAGDCVAFSGRIYKSQVSDDEGQVQAKYLNSPETELFNKSTFLFNLDQARGPIRKTSEVVLSEGYMDVIAMYQAGVGNVLASMGTSLTQQQIGKLKRLAQQVVIAYDGDSPGQKATERAIQLFQEDGHFRLTILPLTNNMDPDELIRSKGADYFLNHLAHERETVFAFYKRYYGAKYQLTNQKDLLDYVDDLLKVLAKENSPTARSLYLKDLASEFQLSPSALEEQLGRYTRQESRQAHRRQAEEAWVQDQGVGTKKPAKSALEQVEWLLLQRILTDQGAYARLNLLDEHFSFETEDYQTLFLHYIGFLQERGGSSQAFLSTLSNTKLQQLVTDALLGGLPTAMSDQEAKDLLQAQEKALLQEKIEGLKREIEEASKAKDSQRVMTLLAEIQKMNENRRRYDRQ